jgi:hypothetical protein
MRIAALVLLPITGGFGLCMRRQAIGTQYEVRNQLALEFGEIP